jgi:hypothetical protein
LIGLAIVIRTDVPQECSPGPDGRPARARGVFRRQRPGRTSWSGASAKASQRPYRAVNWRASGDRIRVLRDVALLRLRVLVVAVDRPRPRRGPTGRVR